MDLWDIIRSLSSFRRARNCTAAPVDWSSMTVTIRPASIRDAPALTRLGIATFSETFGVENAAEDMARYLAAAFTPEQQAAEIADPASVVLLAEHTSETGETELVGYAHLVNGPAPTAV